MGINYYFGFFLCLFASLPAITSAQTKEEENLWEEVVGASTENQALIFVQQYIARFCGSGKSGFYCDQAQFKLQRIQEFSESSKDKCDGLTDIKEKVQCLQDRVKEFGAGDVAEKASAELAILENQVWNQVDSAITNWNLQSFEEYLQMFPNGKFTSTANDRLDFLKSEQELAPEEFYEQEVSAQGLDKLAYFESRYPNSPLSETAKQEANQIEETVWRDAQSSKVVSAYERYLQWYPSGQHTTEARTRINELLAGGQEFRELSVEEKMWRDIVERTKDPDVIRKFLNDYPEGSRFADAEKLLIELETDDWVRAQAQGSAIAYQTYLEKYPDGAFAEEARNQLPGLSNGSEDLLWAGILGNPSINNFQSYLEKYPLGKYFREALVELQKLRDLEYNIKKEGSKYVIQILNAENPHLLPYPYDSLVVDISRLSDNQLKVTILTSGRYQLTLRDDNGKEILVYLSDLLEVVGFDSYLSDSIQMLVRGGFQPYLVDLQDTIESNSWKRDGFPAEFVEGKVAISKKELKNLMGGGVYTVIVKDSKKRNTVLAGVVDLSSSLRSTLSLVGYTLAGFLGLILIWYLLNKRINRRASVFDEMDVQDEWE